MGVVNTLSVDTLSMLLTLMLLLSVVNGTIYKHCRSCDPSEVMMAVFFTSMVILLVIILALIINILLLVALGVVALFVLMAYYAKGENDSPNQNK
jgi:hypothetical protein